MEGCATYRVPQKNRDKRIEMSDGSADLGWRKHYQFIIMFESPCLAGKCYPLYRRRAARSAFSFPSPPLSTFCMTRIHLLCYVFPVKTVRVVTVSNTREQSVGSSVTVRYSSNMSSFSFSFLPFERLPSFLITEQLTHD